MAEHADPRPLDVDAEQQRLLAQSVADEPRATTDPPGSIQVTAPY
jgi:hypothetical protein